MRIHWDYHVQAALPSFLGVNEDCPRNAAFEMYAK